MSVVGNEVMRSSLPSPLDVMGVLPAMQAVNQVVCGSCRGSGQWEEFLPDEVDCMSCNGKGAFSERGGSKALDSEAGTDEFDVADIDAFAEGGWLDCDSQEIEQ